MQLVIEEKKTIIHQIRLDNELNDFVMSVAKDLSCSKSQAMRAMIKFCKNAGWQAENNGGGK